MEREKERCGGGMAGERERERGTDGSIECVHVMRTCMLLRPTCMMMEKPASLCSLYVDAMIYAGPNYPTVHVGNNINDE